MIADRDQTAAEKTVQELRQTGRALAVGCDVSDEDDIRNCVAQTVQEFGRSDTLVNNAGIFPFKNALDMSAEEWDRVQHVNLRGAFLLSRDFSNMSSLRETVG